MMETPPPPPSDIPDVLKHRRNRSNGGVPRRTGTAKNTIRSFSASLPLPESENSKVKRKIKFEVLPEPIEEAPFLRVLNPSVAELEKEITAKNPPGQWFRKNDRIQTDITCLPAELHIEILKSVTFLDQLSCERVCSTWRTIIRRDCAGFRYTRIDDSIWTGISEDSKKPKPVNVRFPPKKTPNQPVVQEYKKPEILIHQLLQDGNFAFRQIPGRGVIAGVEMMSTFHPVHPHHPSRRFKIANLSFLNDPIAIYTSTAFRDRADVPTIEIEFDCEPLRNEFRFRIGGRYSVANSVVALPAALPRMPGMPTTFPFNATTTYSRLMQHPETIFQQEHARLAMKLNRFYTRSWDLGSLLLSILGKIESSTHWYEESALERNARWNGKDVGRKWITGVDFDGDWDMDNGFREPLTLNDIIKKERELTDRYSNNGFWYMRVWGKDTKMDEMHVALTAVSEWAWEICY